MTKFVDDIANSNSTLFGVHFDSCDLITLRDQTLAPLQKGAGVRSVVTANTDHIVRLRVDEKLRQAYANAWRRTIDGTPVHLYARMQSLAVHKVTGADLVPVLLERLQPHTNRLFFVVADHQIARELTKWAGSRGFANDAVRIAVPPMGFDENFHYQTELARDVFLHSPTHLFVGVGCPRSEVWIERFRDDLGDLYAFSVGAALAFHVGLQRRAPKVMRQFGLEWLWRLMMEPRRLAGRYVMRSWGFLHIVAIDVIARIRGRNGYDLNIKGSTSQAE
jgi:N-acetylglucosaminyldiphosphoundecaprenol N-acetyl-beta-D-mannosaminyltransferase